MTEDTRKTPSAILRNLANVLQDEGCDPDDLIHTFGDVEAQRTGVAQLLNSLLEQADQ